MSTDFLPGNRLTLLESGREYFPALLAALESAERDIHLESYIYANDPVGQAVSQALCRAAARGVRVHLTVDGFGARNFPEDFLPRLQAGGVQAMLYRPELSRFRLRRHRLRRLHRKLAVIDGRIGFIGGINIVDDDNAPPDMRPRYDYAVQVEGPLVAAIHHNMRRLWEIVTWANFKRRYRLRQPPPPAPAVAGSQVAAFVTRDNIRHRSDILNAYLAAIRGARRDILIANAYFLPGVRFGRALYAAARRGVRVRILLQGKSDHPLLRYATQTLYRSALAAGIEILEYERSFLHAKVAVIDGEWATVGSSNIDPFSLLLAKEANLVVRDRAFAGELQARLETAIATGARAMDPAELERLPWHSRLLRWASYGIIRLAANLLLPARQEQDED